MTLRSAIDNFAMIDVVDAIGGIAVIATMASIDEDVTDGVVQFADAARGVRDLIGEARARLARLAEASAQLIVSSTQVILRNNVSRIRTKTFYGRDGTPYLRRTKLPNLLGASPVLHRIFRDDADANPHSHPFRGRFLLVSGGYTEERWSLDPEINVWGRSTTRKRPGDVTEVDHDVFRRVFDVLPGTCSVGVVWSDNGRWGFLDPTGAGKFIPWYEFVQGRR